MLTYDGEGGVDMEDVTFYAEDIATEADWLARIAGAGVVWYHDFRTSDEVDAFR